MNKPERQGHTAIPWNISREFYTVIQSNNKGNGNNLIAQTKWSTRLSQEEMEANAAFIVKCVNSHENLVEALIKAQEALLKGNHSVSHIEPLLGQIKEALKEAGEI